MPYKRQISGLSTSIYLTKKNAEVIDKVCGLCPEMSRSELINTVIDNANLMELIEQKQKEKESGNRTEAGN